MTMRSPASRTSSAIRSRPSQADRASAGGQDAVDAQTDEGLEGFARIARHVEGLVEGRAHRAGELDERGGPLAIDGPVGVQQAEDDAGGAEGPGHADVVTHGLELDVEVAEVAPTRADDHMNGQGEAARQRDRARAGGGAPFAQVVAELDPVGPTFLGRDGRRHVRHADFDGDGHPSTPPDATAGARAEVSRGSRWGSQRRAGSTGRSRRRRRAMPARVAGSRCRRPSSRPRGSRRCPT